MKNPLMRPRVPYEILFAIGGWSAGSPTNFVETYDTRCSKVPYHYTSTNKLLSVVIAPISSVAVQRLSRG